MRAYKAIEKPSKFFGLTTEDVVLIGVVVGVYILVLSILTEIGVPVKPIWSRIILAIIVLAMYKTLSWANKNKVPNFLISWISYHFLQNKKLEPQCQYYSKSKIISKSSRIKQDLET